jgi:hypothetical protein
VQRHQTLRAAIDWSYQLCSEAERRLLARLSVFAGGCAEEAAEEVCGDDPLSADGVFELLAGLVAKSLVVAQRDGPTTRYRLLETIREYGEDRLAQDGETDQLRHRHAEYYCQLVGLLSDRLEGREQLDAARRIAAERENLLAAINHAVDTENVDLALRLVRHSPVPGMYLGFVVYLPATVLGLPGATSHDLYPYALVASAGGFATHDDLERVETACQEALEAARRLSSERERRRVEWLITSVRIGRAFALGQWREAARFSEQATRVALEDGREATAARALAAGAMSYVMAGNPQEGIELAENALRMARSTGAPMTVAYCLMTAAGALAAQEPLRSHVLLEEGLAEREHLDVTSVIEVTQATLIAARLGDWPLTLRLADRSIRHQQWEGNFVWLASILSVAARALVGIDIQAAARLQGAAHHLAVQLATGRNTGQVRSDSASPPVQPAGSSLITDLRRQTSALLQDALDEGRLRQLRAEGEAMDSDQAATYALDVIRRARQSQHTDDM